MDGPDESVSETARLRILRELESKPQLYGRDPNLWPLLLESVGKRDFLSFVERIARVLLKDCEDPKQLLCDSIIVIKSPRREVHIVRTGGRYHALLIGQARGAPRRVDRAGAVARFRALLKPLRELKGALKDSARADLQWNRAWAMARGRYPIAKQIEGSNLGEMMRSVVRGHVDVRMIAAHLASIVPGSSKPTVILRDADNTRRFPRSAGPSGAK
jgi:hypothetical protein